MFLGAPPSTGASSPPRERARPRGSCVPRTGKCFGPWAAAVCLQEKMLAEGMACSTFRGARAAIGDRNGLPGEDLPADPRCQNQASSRSTGFDGRMSVWGGECGRYDRSCGRGARTENYFELRQKTWENHMAGVYAPLSDARPDGGGRPTHGGDDPGALPESTVACCGRTSSISWGSDWSSHRPPASGYPRAAWRP